MKISCELCHNLYDENQKGIDIILRGKEYHVRTFIYRGITYKLCQNCLRALAFGIELGESCDIKLKR